MIPSTLTLLLLTLLLQTTTQISFRIFKNKQICISIPNPNVYDFQYLISGQNQQNIYCRIQDGVGQNGIAQILEDFSYKAHYEGKLNFKFDGGKICFRILDNIGKMVSFDLVEMNDPMRGQILQKDLNTLYNNMQKLYRNMQKLYRNQHFYYQRNRAHKQKLLQMQRSVKIIKMWKVGMIVLCGILQFFVVKKMIDRKVGGSSSGVNV